MKLDVKSTANRKIIDFRNYGFKDLQVWGKYNYTKPENKLSTHIHKGMIEICYYDNGSQFFEVNGNEYLVKGGDVFIHFPGEPHGSGGQPEERGCLYWVIIRINKGATDNLTLLCNYLIKKQKRHFKGGKEIKGHFEKIATIYKKRETISIKKIRLHLAVQTLVLSLADRIENESTETDHVRLNKVLTYIDNNITEDISIASLAKELHLSESRFKNLFKELTGFTPGDYVQRQRVKLALQIMKQNPKLSLAEVAYELNFSSPQYFSTVVKKYTGMPPVAIKETKTRHQPSLTK